MSTTTNTPTQTLLATPSKGKGKAPPSLIEKIPSSSLKSGGNGDGDDGDSGGGGFPSSPIRLRARRMSTARTPLTDFDMDFLSSVATVGGTGIADVYAGIMSDEEVMAAWQEFASLFVDESSTIEPHIVAELIRIVWRYVANNSSSQEIVSYRIRFNGHVVPLRSLAEVLGSGKTLRQFFRAQADQVRNFIEATPDWLPGWGRKHGITAANREIGFDFSEVCTGLSRRELVVISYAKSRAVRQAKRVVPADMGVEEAPEEEY